MSFYPSIHNNPYYIVSHPYTRFSAGVRCLHLLCHSLNLRGIPAYIVFMNEHEQMSASSLEPDLLTPILNLHAAKKHFENGLTPITVYPEIISGNPYNSPCITRYILNFPGLLGGATSYSQDELCFSYSKVLAEAVGSPENVLFIPASDTRIFYPPTEPVERSGSCFYASKYQKEHQGKLFEITKDSTEITSQLPTSQSPKEIADLFRKCEVFYTYENTALALEATLCGCPAVFLPNEHLQSIIGNQELGGDGYAWGTDPEVIARAKETVLNSTINYNKLFDEFQKSLTKFIDLTQNKSKKLKYNKDQLASIINHIAPTGVNDFKNQNENYAPLLRKSPRWIEKKAGEFLCSIGLTRDGEFLQTRASRRKSG